MFFKNPGRKLKLIVGFLFLIGTILIVAAAFLCVVAIGSIVDILSNAGLIDYSSAQSISGAAYYIVIIAAVIAFLGLYLVKLVAKVYGDIDDQLNLQTEIQAQIMESLQRIEKSKEDGAEKSRVNILY